MVVWASLAAAKRCLNGESSGKYEVLLSFEDRELAYQESYSELKGAWAACRLRGFINITDRRELPRRLRKWHWSWVKVGLAREVSQWSRVSHICWLDSDATVVPQLEYISDPAHRHLGRSLVFRSLKSLWREFVPKMRADSVQFLGYREHASSTISRPCTFSEDGQHHAMNAGVWIARTPCPVLRDWLAFRPASISPSARWAGRGYEQGEFNAHMALDARVCLVGEMDFAPQSRLVRRTPFVHMYGTGRFVGKSQISRYIFDLVNAMSMVQRGKVPCCAALCNKFRGRSGSAIARAKRAARAKSVAAARRVNGRPTTVKGKRHASVRAAAASAKAGLGAFARKAAKRRRAD